MAEAVRLMIRDSFTGPTGLTPAHVASRVLDAVRAASSGSSPTPESTRSSRPASPVRSPPSRPGRGSRDRPGRRGDQRRAASACPRPPLRDGDRVVLADRHADVLADAARELEADGAEVLAVPTDVTDPDAVDELAARTVEHFGTVHVVCNNAGLVVGGVAWEVPLTDWHRLMDVNLWGVIHGIGPSCRSCSRTTSRSCRQHRVHSGRHRAGRARTVRRQQARGARADRDAVPHIAAAGAGDRIGVTVICPGYVPTRIGYEDRRAAVPEPPPSAVSADDVAHAVVEAMAERRVFVFTHEGTAEQVSAQAAAIVEGRAHVRSR